jgi:hypothetical protein
MIAHSPLVATVVVAAAFGGCVRHPALRPLTFAATDSVSETGGMRQDRSVAPVPRQDRAEYLAQFRGMYALDSVVQGARSDRDKVRLLSRWVRSKWEHNGSNLPKHPDPISILAEAKTGQRFRCVEYAEVLAAALSAVGVPARVLGLQTADSETRKSGAGHVVAEAYLGELGKWAMVDGQWDVMPVLGDTPLNAVELQDAIARRVPGLHVESLSGATTDRYVRWIAEYLYYFDTTPRLWTTGVAAGQPMLMLVPSGAPPPRAFQNSPLPAYRVTRSVNVFYSHP